ncbi:MAG TPA: penicillin-binding protein 2, partial [Streptosporangiaceae bacterium]|nr:penicillin-binding protein 2 [Streptosporangiaceae bacterium]
GNQTAPAARTGQPGSSPRATSRPAPARPGPGRAGAGQAKPSAGSGRSQRFKKLRRTSPTRRLNFALLSVAFAISLIVGRLIQLQGVDAPKLKTLSERQRMATTTVPTPRGQITTSDGTVLAMTVQTDQVTADPPQMKKLSAVAAKLARPLRMKKAAILRLLRHPTSRDYVLIKQSVDVTTADAINKLDLVGIYLTPTYTRVYPGGDLAAGLLGFTNQNKATGVIRGEAGLELAYNRLLTGRSGLLDEEIDPRGQIPNTTSTVRKPVPAGDLRLTIQSDIQWEAEQECAKQVRLTKAKNCSVIVIQPRTGKILALAQYPTFNPSGPILSLTQTEDLPVQEVFAPGSTAKVITAAAAFQYAGETPRTSYTVPDALFWHGAWYRDAENHPPLHYTIAGIIAHSLNDGMVQVAQHVTPSEQYAEFRAFGLGRYTGLNLPGESPGLLRPDTQWTGDYRNERYQISFGQSVDVTAMQMASVYATIANGGVRVAPSIVAGHTTASGRYVRAPKPSTRRVIPAKTAHELLSALEQVPLVYQRGGEPWGIIRGYTVAAKTGTAQEQDNTYGSSFIGIAPATSKDGLVVAVNIQDPRKGGYFGIEVAGPVFNAVMKFALATMKIAPDGGHVANVPLTVP